MPILLIPDDPLRGGLGQDVFLLYVVGVAIFALIWLYYGLVHFKAAPRGVALIGYGTVALSIIATIVFAVVAFYR